LRFARSCRSTASRPWRRALGGVDAGRFLETVRAFNAAPRPEVPFNPNIRDGLGASGLAIDKTNWAQRLDQPPYEAYAVTTGITFTFGGLKITNDAAVEDTTGHPIPGLYAAGEMVGGLFYHNYASGTGLMSGAASAASPARVRLSIRRVDRDAPGRCPPEHQDLKWVA
jgi:tricarballylate dehydrogenase